MLSAATAAVSGVASATTGASSSAGSCAALAAAIALFTASSFGASCSSLYVSQNSRLALPCNNFLTRSGSLIPGSSTRIRPSFSNFWILGATTPKRSIRVRNTLYELSTALFNSLRRIEITSSLVDLGVILSFNWKVLKIAESLTFGSIFLYSL